MVESLLLVDASPLIFRAYFSLPSSIRDPEGRPNNAVFGFSRQVAKLLREEDPSHVVLAYDGSLTTSFRNELYPGYKSSRALPEDDLMAQLDRCLQFGEALGCCCLICDRYEADDLIATARAAAPELRATVVSPDKDLAQMVDDTTELYDFAKDRRWDAQGVHAAMGVRPSQIADFLALAGDSVDDIPGVAGVGKKSATALLGAFADLDAIYADLDGVAQLPVRGAKSLARKLEAGRESAFLSRILATVAIDGELDLDARDMSWDGADRETCEAFAARIGSKGLVELIHRWSEG